jgi:hypothetical protein
MDLDVTKWGLGPRMNTAAVPNNPWMHFILMDAQTTLRFAAPGLPIDLAITEDIRVQAAAVFDPPTILVAGGLADMLCKFAAQLVTAGVFVVFGSAKPDWHPEKSVEVATVRRHLEADRFVWNPAYLPWIADAERVQLFVFLVSSMARFVVLHELGHIHFGHGHTEGQQLAMIVDGEAADTDARRKAIVSQAKEIVADSYALNAHLRMLNAEYDSADLDSMQQLLRDKMLASPRARLRATLLSAFLVFQLLDRHHWTIETAMLASHPPAPFRVKSLYATALELKLPHLPEKEIIEEISVAHVLGNAVLSVGLNRFPNVAWLQVIEGPEFDAQFGEIFAEMPNWIGVQKQMS